MKINSEEINSILKSIDDLIEIKLLIRKIVPNYNLEEPLNEKFLRKLEDLQKKLQPIFSKYLKEDNISKSKKSTKQIKENILEIMKNGNVALVSANSSKKKLKNIGFDPRLLIVSSGPLFFEDYKIVNPNISEEALKKIKKKCERILNQVKNENWNQKDLVFIYENNNPTDKLILKRINELTKLIGKTVKTFEIISWKVLDEI